MSQELLGKLIADKYRILDLVREARSGDLYSGQHEYTGEPVLVSLLPHAVAIDQRWSRRFLDKAKSAASLRHENILPLTDLGTDPRGNVYAVYGQYAGETLDKLLARDGKLDQPRALSIVLQAAAAAGSAHDRGIIHGSLSPLNIQVSQEDEFPDRTRVLGFGGDRLEEPLDADPRYLAPEQLGEYPIADERSDVYALGATLYEMLAGEPPFAGENKAEVLKSISNGPAPLSLFRQDLHKAVEPVVLTAIARDPEERYRTVADLAGDLRNIASEIGMRSASATAGARSVWVTATLAVAGIVLVAATLIYFTTIRKTDPTTMLSPDPDSLPVQPINPATGAQEEAFMRGALSGDPAMFPNGMNMPADMLPGGDGYNAWANGGLPPAGAPLGPASAVPMNGGQPMAGSMPQGPLPPGATLPPGQTVTINPNGGSQFMPNEGGVILIPVPKSDEPAPTPTPKVPAANAAPKPTPEAKPSPQGSQPQTKPDSAEPAKPVPAAKPSPARRGTDE